MAAMSVVSSAAGNPQPNLVFVLVVRTRVPGVATAAGRQRVGHCLGFGALQDAANNVVLLIC